MIYTTKTGVRWLMIVLIMLAVAERPRAQSVTITCCTGAEATVAAGVAGTTYTFAAGTHRIANTIVPKNGDTFTAATVGGATVSGAYLLSSTVGSAPNWTVQAADSSHAAGWTIAIPSTVHSDAGLDGAMECAPVVKPRCAYVEDFTMDDVEKEHVASALNVAAGKWFFDYAASRIYVGDNPSGKENEISYADNAFRSSAAKVTIRNIIIEKFANRAQVGTIHVDSPAGTGWLIDHVELRYSHAIGIMVPNNARVTYSNIHHNYQMGMGSGGTDSEIDHTEIAYNRSAVIGADIGWEAGGTKFAHSVRLWLHHNNVHHNDGPGLWQDISNRATLIEDNTIDDNKWAGVFQEISFSNIIRRNVIRRNGLTHPGAGTNYQLYYPIAGIWIAASPNVQIYENFLENNGTCWTLMQQDRHVNEVGFGEFDGSYRIRGTRIHDNNCAETTTGARTGTNITVGMYADAFAAQVTSLTGTYAGAQDPLFDTTGTEPIRRPAGTGYDNRVECNHYYYGAGSASSNFFDWYDAGHTFAYWQTTYGHDKASSTVCVQDTQRGVGPGTFDGTLRPYSQYIPFDDSEPEPVDVIGTMAQIVVDNFNRIATTGLGGLWTDVNNGWDVALNGGTTSTGQAISRASSADLDPFNYTVYTGPLMTTYTGDQFICAKVQSIGASDGGGLVHGVSTPPYRGYFSSIRCLGSSCEHRLYRIDPGPNFAIIGTWTGVITVNSEICTQAEMRPEGQRIRVLENPPGGDESYTVLKSAIDNTWLTGVVGLWAFSNTVVYDDARMGTFGVIPPGTGTPPFRLRVYPP